jgi:glycosyltransferase involved in cell wall biosynthesis
VTIVDIVVAVRNEELTIPRFIDEVRSLRLPEGVRTRILFVEDGSTDQTLDLLRSQSRHDPSIQYYSLTNPFGQVGALSMGLAHASGDAVIMMDVDGSHPVDILPEMIAEFLAGADIVQGVRLTWFVVFQRAHLGLDGLSDIDAERLFPPRLARRLQRDYRESSQPPFFAYHIHRPG